MTSCRKLPNKLAFHVKYDDGDADTESLGEDCVVFKWHGPRARSGLPPYTDSMRKAMLLLKPRNLAISDQDVVEPVRLYCFWCLTHAWSHVYCSVMLLHCFLLPLRSVRVTPLCAIVSQQPCCVGC